MNSEVSPFKSWLAANRVLVLALFCAVLLPLLVFGKIASEIVEREAIGFDHPIQVWAHAHANSSLDGWMLGASMLGSPPLMVLLCGIITFFLWMKKRRGDLAFFVVATLGAGLLNLTAKRIFGRTRPDLWLSLDPRSDYSFPSGHAMGTMALFMAILVLVWPTKFRVPVLIFGALFVLWVGFSRIYIGVHFPSDVLCGWLASFSWVIGLQMIRNSYRGRAAVKSSTR